MPILCAQFAKLTADLHRAEKRVEAARKIGWRAEPQVAHDIADPQKSSTQRFHRVIVSIGKAADDHLVVCLVPGQQDSPAVAQQIEGATIGDRLQAMPLEIEVADHFGAEQAKRIGRDGIAVAGMELLAHRRTAYDVAALEDQCFVSGLAEVGGCRQPVMPGTDDNRVVNACHAWISLRQCLRASVCLATRANYIWKYWRCGAPKIGTRSRGRSASVELEASPTSMAIEGHLEISGLLLTIKMLYRRAAAG